MPTWAQIVLPIATLILGLIIGGVVVYFVIKKYIKKNPPVNENMIRVMYAQMGRTASEKDIRRIMKQMEQAK